MNDINTFFYEAIDLIQTYREQLLLEQLKTFFEIIAMIAFLFYIYKKFATPHTHLRVLKKPTVRYIDAKTLRPKKKKRLKYFRRFRIPYRGKTKMYTYDKKHGYIESIWEEINK